MSAEAPQPFDGIERLVTNEELALLGRRFLGIQRQRSLDTAAHEASIVELLDEIAQDGLEGSQDE